MVVVVGVDDEEGRNEERGFAGGPWLLLRPRLRLQYVGERSEMWWERPMIRGVVVLVVR